MNTNAASSTALIPVTEAAASKGWRIIASIENPMERGSDQNGIIAFDRGYGIGPHGDENYGVIRWARSPEGDVRFFWGVYDLNRSQAIAVMIEKVGFQGVTA